MQTRRRMRREKRALGKSPDVGRKTNGDDCTRLRQQSLSVRISSINTASASVPSALPQHSHCRSTVPSAQPPHPQRLGIGSIRSVPVSSHRSISTVSASVPSALRQLHPLGFSISCIRSASASTPIRTASATVLSTQSSHQLHSSFFFHSFN